MPAAAVIRRGRALSGMTGRKGCVGGLISWKCNTQGLTRVLLPKLSDLSVGEDSGIPSVAVECVDIRRNISGEGDYLDDNWHWGTKAWGANRIRYPGSPRSKRWILDAGGIHSFCVAANAISIPPGEYGRKVETQRNWRGPAQAAEHVV